jgi:hypothetical protein
MPFDFEMNIHSQNKNFETAIDAEKMRERFQRELGKLQGNKISLPKLYVTRAFPQKEGGFTIQYELYPERPESHGIEKMILCGHLLDPGEDWPDYVRKSGRDCLIMDDIRMIVPVFPFDPGLKSLGDLTKIQQGSHISKAMGDILGKDIEIEEYEILGYRMGRRCVLRYAVQIKNGYSHQHRIVAKVFRHSRLKKSMKISTELQKRGFDHNSPDGITVPRILGCDDRLGVIFMEDAPGITLHFLIGRAIFPDACSVGGRTLRKLHSLDTDGLETYTIREELGNLQRLLKLINNMYPEFGDSFRSKLNDLSNKGPGDAPEGVFSHRDFFDKQLLYSEPRSTLLDCDNAAMADPALDFGNFIAHLILRKLQHSDNSANIDKGINAFIESCGYSGSDFWRRASWWTRASLLRLFSLYLLRPRWRSIAPEILTQPLDFLKKKSYGGAYEE